MRANNCCNHYGKTPCRHFFSLCKKTISSLKRTRYISFEKISNLLEARLKGPGKRGHIVADTLSLMMNECCVSMLRKLGNICCRHKMFLNKIRSIFCVRNKCCARGQTGKHLCRQQCVLVCRGLNHFRYVQDCTQFALTLLVNFSVTCENYRR